jgi:hypothetical protein
MLVTASDDFSGKSNDFFNACSAGWLTDTVSRLLTIARAA